MSRIGKLPVVIPAGVSVDYKDNVITVKGPKGELNQQINPAINLTMEDGHITFEEGEVYEKRDLAPNFSQTKESGRPGNSNGGKNFKRKKNNR